jgi:hypothetical protein
MKNAYLEFFELFSKEKFFQFGIDNIITIEIDKAKIEWEYLKKRIRNKDNDLFVRSSGRNGAGNDDLKRFYKEIFGIQINIDPTNNQKPRKLIDALSGYEINKNIQNYQTSHVFGNTKNVYCFVAPWNIVLLPKIIDPLTGHEAKGTFVAEFQNLFKKTIFDKFKECIEEYNLLIQEKESAISNWVKTNIQATKCRYFINDFEVISI